MVVGNNYNDHVMIIGCNSLTLKLGTIHYGFVPPIYGNCMYLGMIFYWAYHIIWCDIHIIILYCFIEMIYCNSIFILLYARKNVASALT
jgi:hypothetical protein